MVGGGLAESPTALKLAERGYKEVNCYLKHKNIAGQASGMNGGQVFDCPMSVEWNILKINLG